MDFKPFYEPYDDVELMALKARLDEEGIRYTVQGENISAVIIWRIHDYSTRSVMVWEDDFERATKVLEAFLAEKAKHRKPRRPGLLDKIAMVLLLVITFIFAPTSFRMLLARRRKRKEQQKQEQEQQQNR